MISSRTWKLRNRSPHSGDLIKRAIARHLVDRRKARRVAGRRRRTRDLIVAGVLPADGAVA